MKITRSQLKSLIKEEMKRVGHLPAAQMEESDSVSLLTTESALDTLKDVLWDTPVDYWLDRPEVFEYTSLAMKIIGVGLTFTGGGAPFGVTTIRASSIPDIIAAIGWFKKEEYFRGILNLLSAVLSAPPAAISSLFKILTSEKIIEVYTRALVTVTSADKASLAAVKTAEYISGSLPLILDLLIQSLESISNTKTLEIVLQKAEESSADIDINFKAITDEAKSMSKALRAQASALKEKSYAHIANME